MEEPFIRLDTDISLGELASNCGYFVGNCDNHCNNQYGCSHKENKGMIIEHCHIHSPCDQYECPIAFMVYEGEGEVDTLMRLYNSNDNLTFGQFFKQSRILLRKTLRQFCRENDLDPGGIGKLERGRVSAPVRESTLTKYIKALELNSEETQTFLDLAAISAGRIPKDLTEGELAKRLPIIFRTVRGRNVSEDDLRAMVEMIRNS